MHDMPVLDVHTHIGLDTFSGQALTVADLIAMMDAHGVGVSVAFPFPNCPELVCRTPGCRQSLGPPALASTSSRGYTLRCTSCGRSFGGDTVPYYRENLSLISDACKSGGRVLPFACADPRHPGSAAMIDALGASISGVKVHTFICHVNPRDLAGTEFICAIQRHNLPLLFHSGMVEWTRPNYIIDLAETVGNVNIIIAHCARLNRDTLLRMQDLRNVYVDTSLAPLWRGWFGRTDKMSDSDAEMLVQRGELSTQRVFEYLVETVGERQVLYGSDYPYVGSAEYAEGVSSVLIYGAQEIASANMGRLLGLQ
jgi:predicted TIM-barrel fold metal-dependent hydrolase